MPMESWYLGNTVALSIHISFMQHTTSFPSFHIHTDGVSKSEPGDMPDPTKTSVGVLKVGKPRTGS